MLRHLSSATLPDEMGSTPSAGSENVPVSTARLGIRLFAVVDVVRTAIKWGALVWISSNFYRCIAVLAGHTTAADIGIKFLANVKVSDTICVVLTGGSIAYGMGQRQLRRRHIKHVAHDKNELERLLDPKRTSSNLTDRGTTPGDE